MSKCCIHSFFPTFPWLVFKFPAWEMLLTKSRRENPSTSPTWKMRCWRDQNLHLQNQWVFHLHGGNVVHLFSRMRSEGFPFIVGVWGWTCVRFVLLPRRRVVVDSSSCRRHLKEVSHETLVLTLQTFKVRGHLRVLRGRRTTLLEAPWLKSWGSLARNACFGSLSLEKLRKPRTKYSFWKLVLWKVEEASHEMLVLEACSLKSWGSLARNARFGSLSLEKLRKPWRNARFGSLFLEKLRKPRTKCSFWKLLYYFVVRSSTGVVLCSTE